MKTRPLIGPIAGLVLGLSAGLLGHGVAETPTAPVVQAQLRLDSGTFARLAEGVKPAVINVNM